MTQGLLIGAAITIVVGWVVGWVTNRVRAATETRQWEREKLHEAYENFLAAHEHMLTLFGRTLGTTQTDLAMGWRDVQERAARMQLLAPAEIVTAADNLIRALQVYQVDSDAYARMVLATAKDPDKWDDAIEQIYGDASQKHADAKAAFIEAARTDLLQRTRSWMALQSDRLQPSVESSLKRFRRSPKQ